MNARARLTSTLAIICLSGLALAEPVAAGSTTSYWSGPYIGMDFSAGGAGSDVGRGPGTKKLNTNTGSMLIGGHTGYNFQPFGGAANSGWMLGTEIGLSYGHFNSTRTDATLGTVKFKADFLGSARLRAGYAWDQTYLYASAGLGLSNLALQPAGKRKKDITAGLTFGVGLEYAIDRNWSARIEGNIYDFSGNSYRFAGTKRKVDQGLVQVKLGISYRF